MELKDLKYYIESHTTEEDPLLRELDRRTHLCSVMPRMLSGHVQGELLKMFVRMSRPTRILEIGTFTGYSAICMGRAMGEETVLHTTDINDETMMIAEEFISRSGISGIVTHLGSALDVVPMLGEKFDLVFIDGDKREYPAYLEMLLDGNNGEGYLNSGAFLVADNILWDGHVVDNSPKALKDAYTCGVKEYNNRVVADLRLTTVIIPMRDGLSISYYG